MKKELSPERLALLAEYGFGKCPDCDFSYAFGAPAYAMDTHMIVQGDHASDRAYIYYATVDTYEDEHLEGLFYSPSMLEYLLLDFGGEWDPCRMVKDLGKGLDCEVRLVAVHGYPMLFIEIGEYEWKKADIRFEVSDMLKVVGRLDYLLPRKRDRLLAKRRKERA